MSRIGSLLVAGFRWACEVERVLDETLAHLGVRRRYFSQKGQDRWVIERALRGVIGGYFVEIGVGDGRTHSNTYVLERDYGWRGLLIEANPDYLRHIRRHRTASIVCCAVDSASGEGPFLALGYMGGLIANDTDYAIERRARVLRRHADKIISVPCRRLEQIFRSEDVPAQINYLSVDVEGAEERILRDFPFDDYAFDAITIERPTPLIHTWLTNAGYVLDRVHAYDGFYVSAALAARMEILPNAFSGMRRKPF